MKIYNLVIIGFGPAGVAVEVYEASPEHSLIVKNYFKKYA